MPQSNTAGTKTKKRRTEKKRCKQKKKVQNRRKGCKGSKCSTACKLIPMTKSEKVNCFLCDCKY